MLPSPREVDRVISELQGDFKKVCELLPSSLEVHRFISNLLTLVAQQTTKKLPSPLEVNRFISEW